MSKDVFILGAGRSAVGTFSGALAGISPQDLAAQVMQEVISRSALAPDSITQAVVGNCIPTDERYAYVARLASVGAGLPKSSVAMAVNRLCGSGMQAIVSATQAVRLGDCERAVAGGVEVMSRAAYLSTAMRGGARLGDSQMVDAMVAALNDPFGVGHMGVTAENLAQKWDISREEQDRFAAESHRRAAAAQDNGYFDSQIVPVTLKSRRGETVFDKDEHIKPATTVETLATLRPAFKKDGTVTAGNSSGLNDGAGFCVLGDEQAVRDSGRDPLARVVSYAIAGVPNELMGEGPIPASQAALQRAGLRLQDMDVIESNEAFAAQALAVSRALDLDPARTNPNGGAIALGHPVGCSGALITTKALYELQRVKGRYGLVTMCIGGGQGIALIVENLS
ncbi:beta-ketothiolase BktB [Granulosicoccaceae sp. 1_MG-2023]|nr:beta-ketothiolase BktB [Granulosicoccaceae sp. 1_MG-2023]